MHEALAEYCAAHNVEQSRKSGDYAGFFGENNGFQTDGSFCNPATGISVELEIKYQGAGGNTWERNGRFWFPAVRRALEEKCNVRDGAFPLWCVFCGPMVASRKYQEKILGAYGQEYLPNVSLVRDPVFEKDKVLRHFVKYIMPILNGEHPPQVGEHDRGFYHFRGYTAP
ncbi:MAG: hypothetical protein OD918_11575 [Gammaproteobacteria bacterium]